MEIDRIKREQLNKHKEALQLMKSENKSRMVREQRILPINIFLVANVTNSSLI